MGGGLGGDEAETFWCDRTGGTRLGREGFYSQISHVGVLR